MEFECKTVPLTKPILTKDGVLEPLCNSCTQLDCTNPIRKSKISVLGQTKEWYVLVSGQQSYQVVQCSGYAK